MRFRDNLRAGWIPLAVIAVLAFLLGIVVSSISGISSIVSLGQHTSREETITLRTTHIESWDSRDIRRASILYDGCLYRMWYAGADSARRYSIGYAISESGIHWIRYSSAPILTPGGEGSWEESSIREPYVVSTEQGYKMWYVGQDRKGMTRIGCAEPEDGVEWTKCRHNPVLEPDLESEWEQEGISQPTVIVEGDLYKMWYVGAGGAPDSTSAIGYATSRDGHTWEKHPQNPVISADLRLDWERGGIFEPAVVLHGGTYHMWYTGIDDKGIERIGYATSEDGINWTKYTDHPVLLPGDINSWEGKGVFNPAALFANGLYQMWYFGSDARSDGSSVRIGYAVSSDGINWSKHGENPVFGRGPGGRYQNP